MTERVYGVSVITYGRPEVMDLLQREKRNEEDEGPGELLPGLVADELDVRESGRERRRSALDGRTVIVVQVRRVEDRR